MDFKDENWTKIHVEYSASLRLKSVYSSSYSMLEKVETCIFSGTPII